MKIFILTLLLVIAAALYQDFSSHTNTAESKRNLIWNKIVTKGEPASWYSVSEILGLFFEDMNISFNHVSDWLPSNRKKLIHSQGVIGKVKWVPANSSYSGLFRSGSDFGFIRLSLAKEPPVDQQQENAKIIPGVAIKFFRDGQPSANFMAMYSLDGQNSWNFFENPFSNHVAEPTDLFLKALALKFGTASKHATKVGLSDFASFDASGVQEPSPNFPYRLFLVANPSTKKAIDQMKDTLTGEKWLNQFIRVPENSVIYTVYAQDTPSGSIENSVKIADIVLEGALITSYEADRSLFFEHVRMEEDLKLRPQWSSI